MAASENSGLTGEATRGSSPNVLFSMLWVLALIFLAWPVSSIVSGIYILLLPFAACIPALQDVMVVLLRIVNLPGTMGEYIRDGRSCESVQSRG